MKRILITPALIVAAALGLSACSTPFDVSRDTPFDPITPVIEAPTQDWSFTAVEIVVPRTLSVSEANSIKPASDIVWREDPLGDRYVQVEAILRDALTPVLQPREGAATPVVVAIEVTRFHALTERARYTIGGEHEIEFMLTVRHAETGQILSGPRPVDLTFRALGGQAAIQAEAQGITQRVRITERLQEWARVEFPAPLATLISVAEVQN
ncbi:DUF6778 family protein [Roseicyclus persicicus]|uniref:Lipoprotein n=1 Tax=Roseicyclus persicicus TaxID=2650661 RepID=A0A7X6GWY2_9RHOB|nr:DUF6778 family protein [Roseibacterium persicicum]NKX43926.1 hypothetical protein [Roseibacterium persicicum]